jgi:biopolymer transport protein ExbD
LTELKFGRRSRVSEEIPNSSLSDIAFLLLIFFMVSTVFAIEEGLLLQLPSKEGVVKKIALKNIMRITAYPDGSVTIDEEAVSIPSIRQRVEQAIFDNPKIVIVVETHRDAPYGLMVDVLDELKLAQATRISLKQLEEK